MEAKEPGALHISADRVVRQLDGLVPQIHLTLTSVLQGLALAFLVQTIKLPTSFNPDVVLSTCIRYHFYLPYIVSFMTIIIAWNEFAQAAFLLHWPLTALSTSLQFLVAVFEIAAFSNVNSIGAWLFWLGVTSLTGGYINLRNLRITSPKIYVNPEAAKLDNNDLIVRGVTLLFLGLLSFIGLLRAMGFFAKNVYINNQPLVIFDIIAPTLVGLAALFIMHDDGYRYIRGVNSIFSFEPSEYRLNKNGGIEPYTDP